MSVVQIVERSLESRTTDEIQRAVDFIAVVAVVTGSTGE